MLLAFLAVQSWLAIPARIDFPLRVLAVGAVLVFYSRPVIRLRPRHAFASVVMGVVVLAIWLGPDLLFPHYRDFWLFRNRLTGGHVTVAAGPDWHGDGVMLAWRIARAVVIVPVAEELFWRGWLMRWLIDADFRKVPLGAYSPASFWITAALFASEHGPYWDVGLVAGILYNWWMIRTRSLADCVLAHAVTNGLLCAFVVATGRWQYWM
jgi:CAAX prenyl protease-like protein